MAGGMVARGLRSTLAANGHVLMQDLVFSYLAARETPA